MRCGEKFFLVSLVICASFLGLFYFSHKSTWFSGVLMCKASPKERKHVNMDLIFPVGIAAKQPGVYCRRPDVSTITQWLAPIVWEETFDLTVIDTILKPKNFTVATTVFAVGKYVRFLKDFLESAEQHFFVGYRVHYYLFTDLPDEVPVVTLGEGHQLTVIKTPSLNLDEKMPVSTLEMIQKLIEEELIGNADYIFTLPVDSKFYAHWGAETLGDLVGVLHSWLFGLSRAQLTYERRPESQAYIPLDAGDYYYVGTVFGGRLKNVHRMVKTCRMQLDEDQTKQIKALWQGESHVNKYFLYSKPTKLLSPEYMWDDKKEKPSHIKVARFSHVY